MARFDVQCTPDLLGFYSTFVDALSVLFSELVTEHHLKPLLSSSSLGVLDDETRRVLSRYQAERSLIASGLADFDTLQALKRDVARQKQRQVAKPAVATMRASPRAVEATASGYRNLHEFLGGVSE